MSISVSSPIPHASSREWERKRPRLIEVNPALRAEHDLCSYCGKVKYVAYRVVAVDGREAVVCFPCSDLGMNWLEQNFPTRPQ